MTLPNLIVGTVGGGTGLPRQRACLEILGLAGPDHAEPLRRCAPRWPWPARLSIIAALCCGEFTRAHSRRRAGAGAAGPVPRRAREYAGAAAGEDRGRTNAALVDLSEGAVSAVGTRSAHAGVQFVRGLLFAPVRGEDSWPEWRGLVVAFVTCFLFFLQLRIADEFKDFEEDTRYRPYRPVPRGLVTLRELGWIGGGAA